MSKALEILHVKELVHQNHGKVFTDSLSVAENFNKYHKHVLEKIDSYFEIDDEFSRSNFRLRNFKGNDGKEHRKYEMTRDGFTMLAMSFTGKKAFEWKKNYMNAFNTMEQIITQKQNQEWQIARTKGISIRKDLSDTIAQFVSYATSQGSTKANFYFSNITKETYKALKLLEAREKTPSSFRDTLTSFDLSALTMAEYVAQGALMEGMIKRMFYKEIYQYAKEKVLIFASSIAVAKITSDFKNGTLLTRKNQ